MSQPMNSPKYLTAITTHNAALAVYYAAAGHFRAIPGMARPADYDAFEEAVTVKKTADCAFDLAFDAETARLSD